MMAVIVTTTMAGPTLEQYDAVNIALETRGNPPDGLIVHTGAMVDGALQVLDIWESREQAEAFHEGRLHDALVEVLGAQALASGPGPSRAYVEVHDIVAP
jgi:hypothetical protein